MINNFAKSNLIPAKNAVLREWGKNEMRFFNKTCRAIFSVLLQTLVVYHD